VENDFGRTCDGAEEAHGEEIKAGVTTLVSLTKVLGL
jgi:hypothetical protein